MTEIEALCEILCRPKASATAPRLDDQEAAALLRELNTSSRTIAPFSPRIGTLRGIRAKLPTAPSEPPPARPSTPEERDPSRAPRQGRRRPR